MALWKEQDALHKKPVNSLDRPQDGLRSLARCAHLDGHTWSNLGQPQGWSKVAPLIRNCGSLLHQGILLLEFEGRENSRTADEVVWNPCYSSVFRLWQQSNISLLWNPSLLPNPTSSESLPDLNGFNGIHT